jgi:hypothetical protein
MLSGFVTSSSSGRWVPKTDFAISVHRHTVFMWKPKTHWTRHTIYHAKKNLKINFGYTLVAASFLMCLKSSLGFLLSTIASFTNTTTVNMNIASAKFPELFGNIDDLDCLCKFDKKLILHNMNAFVSYIDLMTWYVPKFDQNTHWDEFLIKIRPANTIQLPPSLFAVSLAWLKFLSVTTTVAPSCANLIAAARPIPPPPPKKHIYIHSFIITRQNVKEFFL